MCWSYLKSTTTCFVSVIVCQPLPPTTSLIDPLLPPFGPLFRLWHPSRGVEWSGGGSIGYVSHPYHLRPLHSPSPSEHPPLLEPTPTVSPIPFLSALPLLLLCFSPCIIMYCYLIISVVLGVLSLDILFLGDDAFFPLDECFLVVRLKFENRGCKPNLIHPLLRGAHRSAPCATHVKAVIPNQLLMPCRIVRAFTNLLLKYKLLDFSI